MSFELPIEQCISAACSICDLELGTGKDCANCSLVSRRLPLEVLGEGAAAAYFDAHYDCTVTL